MVFFIRLTNIYRYMRIYEVYTMLLLYRYFLFRFP